MDPVVQADDYDAATARALRQVIDEVRQERDALRAQLHAAHERVRGAQERTRELDGRLAVAEGRTRQVETECQALHTELATIQGSLGWALLQRIHAVKARVLPPGSTAERVLKRLVGRLVGGPPRP